MVTTSEAPITNEYEISHEDKPAPKGLPDPNKGLMRLVYKFPINFFRLGLRPIVGRWFLLMTHIGRKSGQPRHTALEYRLGINDHLYTISGYGAKSQWYKNIMANPIVNIQWLGGIAAYEAYRVTDEAEFRMGIQLYQSQLSQSLDVFLQREGIANDIESIIANRDRIYMIGFKHTDATPPDTLEADLKWVWYVVTGLLALLLLRRRKR